MSKKSSQRFIVTLPEELGMQIERLAQRQQQHVIEVVSEACRRYLESFDTSERDEQYARGYEQVPEDITEVEALLPHLPLPQEDW